MFSRQFTECLPDSIGWRFSWERRGRHTLFGLRVSSEPELVMTNPARPLGLREEELQPRISVAGFKAGSWFSGVGISALAY